MEILDVYDENGMLVIPDKAVEQMYTLIMDIKARKKAVEKNFEICAANFGYGILHEKIGNILLDYGDEIRASRKRVAKSKNRPTQYRTRCKAKKNTPRRGGVFYINGKNV